MRFSKQINFLFKLKQLFYFATLGLFIIWQVLLPFFGSQNNAYISKVLAFVVSIFAVLSVATTLINTSQLTRLAKYFFALTAFAWLVVTIVLYPGIYNFDLANVLIPVANNLTRSWGSHIYSSILMVVYPILPNLFAINLFSVFLLLALVFRLAKNFPPQSGFKTIVFILIFNLPVLHLFLNCSYRDIVASLISALLIEILFRVYKNGALSVYEFIEICTFTTICILTKGDHMHYLIVVPLALWIYAFKNSRKSKILYSLTIFLLPLAVSFLYEINKIEMKNTYKLSLLWNPLNEIIYTRDAEIPESDKKVISTIINYDYLKNNHDPYEIEGFHKREYKIKFPQQDFNQLLKVYLSLAWQHWDIFLQNRVKIFLRANELAGPSYLYQDQLNQWNEHVNKYVKGLEIAYPTFNTDTKSNYFTFIEKHIRSNQVLAAFLTGTAVFVFIFIINAFLVYRKNQYHIIFQLIFFRLLLVFLSAPAYQLKYHGYFLFPNLAFLICALALYEPSIKASKPTGAS